MIPREQTLSQAALRSVAAAGPDLVGAEDLDAVLGELAAAAASGTGATLAVFRVADGTGKELRARAVWAASPALRAELEGSKVGVEALGTRELTESDALPEPIARLTRRWGASSVLVVPVVSAGRVTGSLELARAGDGFSATEAVLARVVARHAALLVRAVDPVNGAATAAGPSAALELAGRGLAAVADESRTAEGIVRLALEATGARSCVLWRTDAEEPAASAGEPTARSAQNPEAGPAGRPSASLGEGVVLVRLGEPPLGVLQLEFEPEQEPGDEELARLAAFGARAGRALRVGERTSDLAQELERSRALLAVVGQAIAELSLSHTLETAVDRVAELLGSDRAAVYLRQAGGLETAVERGLAGPHLRVAEGILDLILSRLRTRAVVEVRDLPGDPRLGAIRDAVGEAGLEAAVVVPLRSAGDLIGLLVAYQPRAHRLGENESTLLAALAGQLAVAVQNAGLHEETARLARDREQALESERLAARRLEAFYEISRSFSESLSLDETVDAVTRAAVELLDVDAAVLRMPSARGDTLVPHAVHVPDPRLAVALDPILRHEQPLEPLAELRPGLLTPGEARRLGGGHELLLPFLERGSTATVVPIVSSGEVMAALTLLSLDPERRIDAQTLEAARSLTAQAALAIANARLYQQQVHFADAMQRSLLPDEPPAIPGVEIGSVYESSARLDVGGDVFDYSLLPDGRLAVVVGDVTGKGIDAAADMAMTKFVFRSLAREHPEPSELLRIANQVVLDEVGDGKFVTMLCLTVDPATGELACAGAGHPDPRLVRPDGTVVELAARGLALGVAPDQEYPETRATLEPGAAVVLFTDGVVEARVDAELYGSHRLDRLLAAQRHLSPADLARAVVEDSRAFAGGALTDDSAVVVVKKTAG
ncbi:MAG TPA: SpoIIE family protein phosphatase [Gaiellaceae bacterium]|jgi:sigma-B regulation protein RsbU (phosphoserine phosphatase)|nr:SpoIIE family protein phosphatase [Gaiellaceae bacterium]